MIETIASVGLPIDEMLEIKKNRIMPDSPSKNMKRISIVTLIIFLLQQLILSVSVHHRPT